MSRNSVPFLYTAKRDMQTIVRPICNRFFLFRSNTTLNLAMNWLYTSLGVLLAVLLWQTLRIYVFVAATTAAGTVAVIVYWSATTSASRPRNTNHWAPNDGVKAHSKHGHLKRYRYSFLNLQKWNLEVERVTVLKLKLAQTLAASLAPMIEKSFLISESINDFFNLIVAQFIDGWYLNVSKSRNLFQDNIHRELAVVVQNLQSRLVKMDYAQLVVTKIIPILHEHFKNSLDAHGRAKAAEMSAKGTFLPSDTSEYAIAVAKHYKGGLKGRVTLYVSEPSNFKSHDIPLASSNSEEKKYLREKIGSILPALLSKDEQNTMVVSLIREILSCTILTSVFLMLREGDFYNVLIVKLIGDNLKHRTQVKQLRKALAEHTQGGSLTLQSDYNIDMILQLLEATDYADFKKMYEGIGHVDSIETLNQLNAFLISLFSSTSAGTKYEKRLKLLVGTVKKRLLQLNNSAVNAKGILLRSIFKNETASLAFDEFLTENNKHVLVEFWKDVEKIKDPLEDSAYNNEETDIDNDSLFDEGLLVAYANSEDIIRIYKNYFYNLTLSFKRSSIEVMEDYISSRVNHSNTNDPERIAYYRKARREIMKLHQEVFQRLEDREVAAFKTSPRFLKLIESGAFRESTSTPISTPKLQHTIEPFPRIPMAVPKRDTKATAVKAVEDAFSEIMKDSSDPANSKRLSAVIYKSGPTTSLSSLPRTSLVTLADSLNLLDKNLPAHLNINNANASNGPLTINLKRNLFGESDYPSLFGTDSETSSTIVAGLKLRDKLFDDDESDESNSDDSYHYESNSPLANSMEFEYSMPAPFGENSEFDSQEENEVYLAAPGNLRLSEEIVKLEQEIEELKEQLIILTPLLNKAELTNNVGELKILKRSKIGLEREIGYKELQKQQYIVQENDNSLFGKSKVSIQSYITGSDGGKEITLYIIEVQKLSNDDPDVVIAGWIVARRYSQFYKLNEYLKARYPFICNINFPKRAVLVLKFQQKQIVEIRKSALSAYLQEIIAIPQVCSDRAFRSFLSSENFSLHKDELFEESLSRESKRLLKMSGIELIANKLYGQTKLLLIPLNETFLSTSTTTATNNYSINNIGDSGNSGLKNSGSGVDDYVVDEKSLETLTEMQNELRQFDGLKQQKSFVKPICDILISIFRLNTSKTWLRGRALLAILQQIFGTTIERKVYEMVEQRLKNEETILDLLNLLQNIVFPNGKFKDPPIIRTFHQRTVSKQEAKVLFGIFFQETCSKLFGSSNTNFASTSIFEMLQNDYLNEYLLFEILDVVLNEIFQSDLK